VKALSKKARARVEEKQAENVEYVEMLDLCVLHAYRRLVGAGRKRLEDFMLEVAKVHIDYEHGYFQKNDRATIGARGDVLAMKRHFSEHGIDYDAMCERVGKKAHDYELRTYGRMGK
jgi:hypothetical protein